MEIYGQKVYPPQEAAKLLGISVDDFLAKAGWGSGYPAVRGPGGVVGLREDHLAEWQRRLHPRKPQPQAEPRPTRTMLANGEFVMDPTTQPGSEPWGP